MSVLLGAVFAYLLGSVSFAVVWSRVFGLPDPRTYGSGNPGATNVLRSGRKAAAVLTLVGDAAKGAVAVGVVRALGIGDAGVALAAVAAFVGHLYPVYFGFKGGKGVATAFGILVALSPVLALGVLATFATVILASRYVSLASVLSAAAASVIAPFLFGWGAITGAVLAMAVLIVVRHRANIHRLIAGEEATIRLRKPRPAPLREPSATRDPSGVEH
ncbi:MAG: glycerol-3-phosphate 1-O-acyltransferase PlsY [Burkholderiales bacterium]|nr:glycerol-3-phosphate 1-O-acyltransferase PlsY [Burkholderiales bacterium]